MLHLPYAEDVRQYVFGSLPVKGAEPSGALTINTQSVIILEEFFHIIEQKLMSEIAQ
jgi:hypothetical protein